MQDGWQVNFVDQPHLMIKLRNSARKLLTEVTRILAFQVWLVVIPSDHQPAQVLAHSEPFSLMYWLKQFYLVLATWLGSAELVPQLIDVARETAEPLRMLALGALASSTSWDARFDAQGRPREPSAVARDYAAECAR